jgi:undecaprenyl-diphosphatase
VATGSEPTASFPSGHVAAAVVLYVGLSIVVPRLAPPTDDPRPFRALVALAIVAVSVARVYEGMHFPSDVVVGWAYGAGCLAVGLAAADQLGPTGEAGPAGDGAAQSRRRSSLRYWRPRST